MNKKIVGIITAVVVAVVCVAVLSVGFIRYNSAQSRLDDVNQKLSMVDKELSDSSASHSESLNRLSSDARRNVYAMSTQN